MKAITEGYLRHRFRDGDQESFTLEAGMLLTPAARQFLQERRIELKSVGREKAVKTGSGKAKGRYILAETGEHLAYKPEQHTQLHGNHLVRKDHPRIRLRGGLDSLQADLLLLHQSLYADRPELAAELAELLAWAREIMRAEVLERSPVELRLGDLTCTELHKRSHQPQSFFGRGHLLPEPGMAPWLLAVNKLRTTVREVELVAVEAFAESSHPAGLQIIEALNRMSSAVYVLMLKHQYQDEGHSHG